ncbi:NAD(P)H-dependent oxidoreductase [Blattabacterium cuenoti]|uniref:NAD(P)H-dependent oxidoreductase n=1 Tax=Blattabacterium cuenoti TaxID=1653831 RepID=UPI00163C6FBA|nr:NAD(P)H-dependent oxidoreductase [Blattabacterium cuenoti]
MNYKILFIVAHPNIKQSILNRHIIDYIIIKYNKNVLIRQLYELYPDFKINVIEEIKIILSVQCIVFQFPFYWYSYPSLFKEWKDKVFTELYTTKNFLSGKHLLISITTGADETSFHAGEKNNFTLDEFLRPIQQTAYIFQMIYHGYMHISMQSISSYNKFIILNQHSDNIINKIKKIVLEK